MPKHKSFTLGELAKATNTEVVGNSDCHINNLSTIDSASEGSITFLTNKKYLHSLDNCMASAIVVSKEFKEDNRFNFLKSEDPYLTYAKLSKIFKYEEESLSPSIHESAVISEVLSTGPCAVTAAKELTLGFDRWSGDDESLRLWTLDFTSRMRGSEEGQEGLTSFLEKRSANWKSEE